MEIHFDKVDILVGYLFGYNSIVTSRRPECIKEISAKLRMYLESLPDKGEGLFAIVNECHAATYIHEGDIVKAFQRAKERSINLRTRLEAAKAYIQALKKHACLIRMKYK